MPMSHADSVSPSDQHARTDRLVRAGGNNDQTSQASPAGIYNPFFTGRPRSPIGAPKSDAVDRQEIIRRIKSGEPDQRHTLSYDCSQPKPVSPPSLNDTKVDGWPEQPEQRTRKRKSPSPPTLLPSPHFPHHEDQTREHAQDTSSSPGFYIQRPRSALHTGDFRDQIAGPSWPLDGSRDIIAVTRQEELCGHPAPTSPVAPWHREFPARHHRLDGTATSPPRASIIDDIARPRAFSRASLSGSFTYQPPTSPLVHQANAADIPDYAPGPSRHHSRSPDNNRRRTYSPRLSYSPHSLHTFHSDPAYPASTRLPTSATLATLATSATPATPATLRRESTVPYQAHQPRKSSNSLPQTPPFGHRHSSISDGSPLQHAPMVGSYEESILRGRMSTTPSRPLNFVAQIGVLGKGDCKPSLKCPPHIAVPFPAVFYSYGSAQTLSSPGDPQPSPYVGLIDLENALKNTTDIKRRHGHLASANDHDSRASSRSGREDETGSDSASRLRRRQKLSRRSRPSREVPSGGYRIPQQGQLQIVIKSPNKTAVKLFLVPYDLSDMEPGQRTFIRQRSYSAGPIVDMLMPSRKDLGIDRPDAAQPKDRPILRYLVHLHICSPAKGRFYLYKSIRVVFANRVPDGKEKLRNEIQMPEPRYTVYKPGAAGRDSNPGLATPSLESRARRRSVVGPDGVHSADGIVPHDVFRASTGSLPLDGAARGLRDSRASARFPDLPTVFSRPSSRGLHRPGELGIDGDPHGVRTGDAVDDAPLSPLSLAPSPAISRVASSSSGFSTRAALAEPLSFSRASSQERQVSGVKAESLLSRRLKDLEMRGQRKKE